MDAVLEANTKCYQLWHHRRFVVERFASRGMRSRALELELGFLCAVLEEEPKHYHAWAHRQWLVVAMGGPATRWVPGELAFTASMLAADALNNSAWNHRYFVLQRLAASMGTGGGQQNGKGQGEEDGSDCVDQAGDANATWQEEACFAMEVLRTCFENESAWTYLKALLFQAGDAMGVPEGAHGALRAAVRRFCVEVAAREAPRCCRNLALAAEIDYAAGAAAGGADRIQSAVHLWRQVQRADVIRRDFWQLKIDCALART